MRTDRGDVEAEYVVIACGVWSPRLARMAGASIPLTPAVHQMIDVGPVPRFETSKSAIEFPIVRDMDTNMYERQDGSGLEVGSYAHRPILHDPDEIPSIEESALTPTELPFTQDDFVQQMEHALELVPEILGDESVGIKYAINGLLSLTPDGLPILGETSEVRGLWSAAAVWVKEGPGVGPRAGRVDGPGRARDRPPGIRRRPLLRAPEDAPSTCRAAPPRASTRPTASCTRASSGSRARRVRLSPFYEREKELGAVFYEAAGWERPHWYESNAPLLEEFADQVDEREAEWDSRWWSPIINAEHLAMRDRAAMFDLTAFCVFDIVGPGALECVQKVSMRQMDVKLGKVVYTPVLTPRGGFRSDLTVMRLGDEHFRVVTGGAHGMADLKWYRDHLPEDGTAQIFDLTSSWTTLGLWGPRAPRHPARASRATTSRTRASRSPPAETIEMGPLRVLASRISYVGDLGWELYVPIEQGARLWDIVAEAGEPHGIVPAGIGVYGTTGRLEKCYRAFGFELDGEYNVVEAGMAWGKVKDQDFVGKEAHVRQREEEPADRHVHAHGGRPHLRQRREALHARRRADRDARRRARSWTRTGAART